MTTIIKSIADIEPAIKELQHLDAKVRGAYENLASEQAQRKAEVDTVYADDINRKAEIEEAIRGFVDKNKTDVFADGKKSREFPSGTISLRLGPLAVALRKGVTIEMVKEAAKKLKLVILRQPAEELDKEAVKKHVKAGIIDGDRLTELGIVASQSETINIKLNDQ